MNITGQTQSKLIKGIEIMSKLIHEVPVASCAAKGAGLVIMSKRQTSIDLDTVVECLSAYNPVLQWSEIIGFHRPKRATGRCFVVLSCVVGGGYGLLGFGFKTRSTVFES